MKSLKENKSNFAAIDTYLQRVYNFIMVAPSGVAVTSAIFYTVFYNIGWYKEIPFFLLVLFDFTNFLYAYISFEFLIQGFRGDSLTKIQNLSRHKLLVAIIILIQWNFTSYLIPYRDWWAWAPFFIMFSVFFFDSRLTFLTCLGVNFSTLLSWVLRKDVLFVEYNKYFMPNLIMRIMYLLLFSILLYSLALLGGKYLVDELQNFANYDTLTHLLNRRSLDEYLKNMYERAESGDTNLSVLMIDIDDFKKVNDTFGHDAGDEVLKSVASKIQANSGGGKVFRWGGEEILVVLNSPLENAVKIAEDIRSSIEYSIMYLKDSNLKLKITVTIGVDSFKPNKSLQVMMESVDSKLYFGKRNGKNQVVSDIKD